MVIRNIIFDNKQLSAYGYFEESCFVGRISLGNNKYIDLEFKENDVIKITEKELISDIEVILNFLKKYLTNFINLNYSDVLIIENF